MSELSEAEGALAAMNRAAQIARVRAARFGSRVAILKNGRIVLLDPRTMREEESSLQGDENMKSESQERSR